MVLHGETLQSCEDFGSLLSNLSQAPAVFLHETEAQCEVQGEPVVNLTMKCRYASGGCLVVMLIVQLGGLQDVLQCDVDRWNSH